MSQSASGRQATAIGLISLGVLFLLAQTFHFNFMGTMWPLFVAVPGLAFLFGAIKGDDNKAGLAIPGAMITGTGAILFYQNLTGHWESWAYIWALYPVFFGLAMIFMGRRTGSSDQVNVGDKFVKFGLFGFVGLWALFELFIFGGNSALVTTVMPLVLIGAGIFLLMRGGDQAKIKFGSRKPKYTNGHHSAKHDDLQAKIDAALAEDDEIII